MADRRDLRDPRDLRASALANIGPADNPEMVAIALGLLYIGDQIRRLAPKSDERGALIDSGYVPLDTRLVGVGDARAQFAIGPRVFEVLIGESFELFIDASGGVNVAAGER